MKKIAFLSGTRADFGKLKSLISSLAATPEEFQVEIYVTGMHMNPDYGNTHLEVESAFKHLKVHLFNNHDEPDSMDIVLAKTIMGLFGILKRSKPELLVVHGDRVEAVAGAIVASLNNTLVAHIEGGEVSGTIDELMRHAITKMSHLHFVSNESAFQNVLQLGEDRESIHVIGSPDIDVMNAPGLPSLAEVTSYYGIPFENYAILLYHPVTTNLLSVEQAGIVRYYPSKQSELQRCAQLARPNKLSDFWKALIDARRHELHALAHRVQIEALLIRYQEIFKD